MKLLLHLLLERKPLLGEKLQASVYHLRIIEDALVLRDFLQGLIYAPSRSVRSVRDHGLNNIGYTQDRCFQDNLLTR